MRYCLQLKSRGVAVFVTALIALLSIDTAPAQDGANENADDDSGFKYIEVTVLDPEGEPLADAAVEVSMDGIDFPVMTDEEGIASLNVPGKVERSLMLGVRQDGYAAVGARWGKGDKIPDEFTIRVKKGIAIGGVVHDEDGNPVEGVDIEVTMSSGNPTSGELRPWFGGFLSTTDSEGRWQTETAPEKKIQLYFRLNHEDFINDRGYGQQRPTWKQLKSLDYVFVIKKGIEIRGRVVDADDQPVVGAKVKSGADGYSGTNVSAETDENGEYVLKKVKAGPSAVTVVAEGLSADFRRITASKEAEPVDFQLQAGNRIRFHVTDPDGQSLEGTSVRPERWRGTRNLFHDLVPDKTDADGVWEWDGAPADEIQFNFYLQDHMSARDKKFVPREATYEIQLGCPLVLSGKVVDAESGKPIDNFEITEGIRWNGQQNVTWQTGRHETGQAGKYQVKYTSDCEGYRIKIRAAGYRPVTSELIAIDAGEVTIDFELEAGSGPSGVVKMPTGEPAEGAIVVMAVVNQYVQINNGEFQQQSEAAKAVANDEGKFKLPFPDDNYLVVVVHDAGWKQLTAKQLEESGEVTLVPWSKIEGKLLRGDEPLAGERINASKTMQYRQGQPYVSWSNNAQTEGDGSFVFERVRAGTTTVSRRFSYGDIGNGSSMGAQTHSEHIELEPGKTAQVQLGGVGNRLKGRLVVPDDYEGKVVWAMGVVHFSEQMQQTAVQAAVRNPLQALGRAIAQLGQKQPPTKKPAQQKQPRRYATTIAEDGSFEIFDVAPGKYLMNVQILEPPLDGNYRWNPIATFHQAITVPEVKDAAGDESVDLGEHELVMTKPKPTPPSSGGTLQLKAE